MKYVLDNSYRLILWKLDAPHGWVYGEEEKTPPENLRPVREDTRLRAGDGIFLTGIRRWIRIL